MKVYRITYTLYKSNAGEKSCNKIIFYLLEISNIEITKPLWNKGKYKGNAQWKPHKTDYWFCTSINGKIIAKIKGADRYCNLYLGVCT